jgi:hypothetical protein
MYSSRVGQKNDSNETDNFNLPHNVGQSKSDRPSN